MEGNKKHIDGTEFVRLITANQRRIYAYIVTLVVNVNDSEDILQDTTAMMWERKEDFVPGTDFVAWGVRLAYFKILDYRKKTKRNSRMIIPDDRFKQIADKAHSENEKTDDIIHRLRECLERLSQRDQQLMHLRYSKGLSTKEISVRIHRSIRTIYYNICRIQGLLMACVGRHEA